MARLGKVVLASGASLLVLGASSLLGPAWTHIVFKVEEESLMPGGIPPC